MCTPRVSSRGEEMRAGLPHKSCLYTHCSSLFRLMHSVPFQHTVLRKCYFNCTFMFKKYIFKVSNWQSHNNSILSHNFDLSHLWSNSSKGQLWQCVRNLSSAGPVLPERCFVISFGSTVIVSDSQLIYFLFLQQQYTRGTVFLFLKAVSSTYEVKKLALLDFDLWALCSRETL